MTRPLGIVLLVALGAQLPLALWQQHRMNELTTEIEQALAARNETLEDVARIWKQLPRDWKRLRAKVFGGGPEPPFEAVIERQQVSRRHPFVLLLPLGIAMAIASIILPIQHAPARRLPRRGTRLRLLLGTIAPIPLGFLAGHPGIVLVASMLLLLWGRDAALIRMFAWRSPYAGVPPIGWGAPWHALLLSAAGFVVLFGLWLAFADPWLESARRPLLGASAMLGMLPGLATILVTVLCAHHRACRPRGRAQAPPQRHVQAVFE